MAPYYHQVCEQLGWIEEDDRMEKMVKANQEALAKLDAALKGVSVCLEPRCSYSLVSCQLPCSTCPLHLREPADAEENQGELEVRDALVARAIHFATIGDRVKLLSLVTDNASNPYSPAASFSPSSIHPPFPSAGQH